MLKNWLNGVRTRNFIKSLFLFDFFIKKTIQNMLTYTSVFSIFFLEKFVIEYTPKKIQNLINTVTTKSIFTKETFFPFVLVPINILLIFMLM